MDSRTIDSSNGLEEKHKTFLCWLREREFLSMCFDPPSSCVAYTYSLYCIIFLTSILVFIFLSLHGSMEANIFNFSIVVHLSYLLLFRLIPFVFFHSTSVPCRPWLFKFYLWMPDVWAHQSLSLLSGPPLPWASANHKMCVHYVALISTVRCAWVCSILRFAVICA